MNTRLFENRHNFFIKIRKTNAVFCLAITLCCGFLGGMHVKDMMQSNSDVKQVKNRILQPISTREYKHYKFTHIDYYAPQYVNTIIDKRMLNEIKADIKAGIISVASPQLGVEIGDVIKYNSL